MVRATAFALIMPSLVRPFRMILSRVLLTAGLLTMGLFPGKGGLFSEIAQAQVATSDLTPGQTLFIVIDTTGINNTSFTPHNPAAIQWSLASKIGIGNIDGGSESTDPGGTQIKSHEGGFGGILFSGESAAFSAAKIFAEDTGQGFKKTFESTHFQFSLNLGGVLAAGVGLENTTVEEEIPVFPGVFTPFQFETEYKTYGVSLNFENRLFIGYAQGTREITVSLPEFSFSEVLGKGTFTKKGVALRSTGDWKWYLERFILDFQAVENVPGTAIKITTDALQTNIHGVLIGFSLTEVELEQDPSQPLVEQNIEITAVDLGWVPDEGLAFTLRLITVESEEFDPAFPLSNSSETIKTASFAVSYLF